MRKFFWFLSICVFVGLYFLYAWFPVLSIVLTVLLVPVFLLGVCDVFQKRQAIKRNFPVIGHFRYMLEAIRPEIQQYFVESNTDGKPIDRNMRSVVYQRAKKQLQTQPFGTQLDLYKEGREWICHSMFPKDVCENFERFTVGSSQCLKPYSASRLNISAMSYGSLSRRAVEALNKGAAIGNFYHNTGEGGISEFHKKGGDLVWQIGTGYFGCRTDDGQFCRKTFAEKATQDCVKMIELKLSQGAKPGKGGMLPGSKVTSEIAEIRGVPQGKDILSPAGHVAFSDVVGLLEFVKELRELCGGKPVGIKICIGVKKEFLDIINAIKSTQIFPDFISVDGSEGGTGAAPVEFANSVGMPLKDGLSFVSHSLEEADLRKEIKVFASGKLLTGFDMLKAFALGADGINSARGMMLALGCIQALRCHSNHCPVGITTNNPELVKGLNVGDKAQRVANYHEETIKAAKTLLKATGKESPEKLARCDIYQRQSDGTYKTFDQIYGKM